MYGDLLPLHRHALVGQHRQHAAVIALELEVAQPHHGEVVSHHAGHGDLPVGELAGVGDHVFYGLVSEVMQAGTTVVSNRAAQGASNQPQQGFYHRFHLLLSGGLKVTAARTASLSRPAASWSFKV